MTIKNRLKVILAQKNIPQSELVEKLNINKSTISNIVGERQNATLDIAMQLSEFLNVKIEDIFYKEYNHNHGFDFDTANFDVLIDKINKTYKLYEENVITQDQLITLYKEFERNFKEKYGMLSILSMFEFYIKDGNIEINDIARQVFMYGVI